MKKNNLFNNIKSFIITHKFWSAIIFIALVFICYKIFSSSTVTETRYVTGLAVKGTVIASVSGSGQVSASNQIDLKPNVSDSLVRINIKSGDKVYKNESLFYINDKTAMKALRDAQIALDSAKLDLATTKAQMDNTDSNQQVAIDATYKTLLNGDIVAVPPDNSSNTIIPPTITGNYTGDKEGQIVIDTYIAGGGTYFVNSGLVTGNGIVSTNTAQPIGDSGLFIKFSSSNTQSKWVINIPNKSGSSYLQNYNAYQNALQSKNQNNSQSQVNSLNLQSKELAVKQKENALLDAKQNLAEYNIVAPFNGIMASVSAQLGQTTSSGAALGTIITNQKLAVISLNEVDVSKIKLGQKATLTFDAISGLSIVGEVVSIDAVGTVTSGVVTYNVKISFDTVDNRIKPGMSITAAIITDVKQDVLTIPNGALKTKNNSSSVEVFDIQLPAPLSGVTGSISPVLPHEQLIETGLSNETVTEVISGLKENSIVVTRTISSSTTKTTTAPNILNAVGAGGGRGLGGGRGGN